MSTNTTSTSDRSEVDSPTSSPAQENEGSQKGETVSPFAAEFPDREGIARFPNEFFAALPGAAEFPKTTARAPSPNEVDLRVPSGSAPGTAIPDYQREMFTPPAVPNPGTVSAHPEMQWPVPIGPLNESDFHAIAASLTGVTALVPHVPTPALPNPSLSSFGEETSGPW